MRLEPFDFPDSLPAGDPSELFPVDELLRRRLRTTPRGEFVLVNGKIVFADAETMGARTGRVLRHEN